MFTWTTWCQMSHSPYDLSSVFLSIKAECSLPTEKKCRNVKKQTTQLSQTENVNTNTKSHIILKCLRKVLKNRKFG